jgi:hypothetical protein
MRIWKFRLEITDSQQVKMPEGARVIHVGLDPQGELCMWAEVMVQNKQTERTIYVVGTGHVVSPNAKYLGSVTMNPFVWHVYE